MMRALLASALLAACGTDSIDPAATVEAVMPEMLTASDDALDDLTIVVGYDDGDGDLGGGTARIQDCRGDGLVTELPIPTIAPDGIAGDSRITGTIELHVNDVGAVTAGALPATCADLGVPAMAAGEAVFCVTLVDAKGHEGPGDCTKTIAIAE